MGQLSEATPARVPGISVIVPTFRDADAAIRTARALCAELGAADELLIVDNGSEAPHRAACERFAAAQAQVAVRTLVCPMRGSYAARNLGASQARGDILAFTDAGCVPHPGWLAAVRAHLSAGAASRVTGPIEMTYRRAVPSLVELVDARMHLNQDGYAAQGWAATANMAIWRDAFVRLGGFHRALQSGGDYEFGLRAMAAGHDIGWAPDMVVAHEARTTWRELLTKRRRVRAGHAQVLALPGFAAMREQALHAASLRRLVAHQRGYPAMGAGRWQLGRVATRLLREVEGRQDRHG